MGDGVDVSVLDGLVVDLTRSLGELSQPGDIIMPTDMGPLKQHEVTLASGTARVVKLARTAAST